MSTTHRPASDVAFSPAVKAVQARMGSRRGYERVEQAGGWETTVTPQLQAFIAGQSSFYLATANAQGQPYIQHRGGPPGFLHVLDPHTLGFADNVGNKQFITVGNLSENPKVHLFLMDYAHRQRVKVWGTAQVVEDDALLLQRLTPAGVNARPERSVLIHITAWDANCPQHIPVLLPAADVSRALAEKDAHIARLQAQLDALDKGRRG